MLFTSDHFLLTEVDYRRERIRAAYAATARRRRARRARLRPAARRAAAHVSSRLATGS